MASAKLMRAGGTIRRARFVNILTSANNTVEEADANDRTIGISQVGGREAPIPSVSASPPEAAQSGDQLQIFLPGEPALLEIGSGGCTAGDELISDTNGCGVIRATTGTTIQNVGAIALETAVAGELAKVFVVYAHVRPALS